MEKMHFDVFGIKDALIAGGWILTIVGWYISSSQALGRERRKEIRSEVDSCVKACELIFQLCRAYYSKAGDDVSEIESSTRLNFELYRLFGRVERLQKRCPKIDVGGLMVELLDSAAGDDFQSRARVAVALNSDRLLRIQSDIQSLIDSLENGFVDQFN